MLRRFVFTLSFVVLGYASQAMAQLRTVPRVEIPQYAGTWYQIAANPEIFEAGCKCSRQLLTPREDGKLDVYNSCTEELTGRLREIHGVATNDDEATNARYTVDFNLPWKGQYWIIALAEDYRYAVVSEPDKKSLFILSRTPTMTPEDYELAVNEASTQVNIGNLRTTDQVGCEYP